MLLLKSLYSLFFSAVYSCQALFVCFCLSAYLCSPFLNLLCLRSFLFFHFFFPFLLFSSLSQYCEGEDSAFFQKFLGLFLTPPPHTHTQTNKHAHTHIYTHSLFSTCCLNFSPLFPYSALLCSETISRF